MGSTWSWLLPWDVTTRDSQDNEHMERAEEGPGLFGPGGFADTIHEAVEQAALDVESDLQADPESEADPDGESGGEGDGDSEGDESDSDGEGGDSDGEGGEGGDK